MNGSLMQEQTTGPAYFYTSPSAVGASKKPMDIPETSNAPKTAPVPQPAIQSPQLTPSQPMVFLAPQIASLAQKIARDYGEVYFKNQGPYAQSIYHDEIPPGYHAFSNFGGNYAPNPGYQSTQRYNYVPEQAPNRYTQPAGANTDDIVNRIADVIQNQFET